MWIVQTEQLHFHQASDFSDTYEGKFPQFIKDVYQAHWGDNFEDGKEFIQSTRDITFLNCWHKNSYESAAMWEQYSTAGKGIAIKTTRKKLLKSINYDLPEKSITARDLDVIYIDFEKGYDDLEEDQLDKLDESIDIDRSGMETSQLYRFKRREYDYENELRICLQFNYLIDGDDDSGQESPFELKKSESDYGPSEIPVDSYLYLPVAVDELIDEIYVKPNMDEWVVNSIKEALDSREDLDLSSADVTRSDLDEF
ncbi:DUF2971 domain-containing protein [Halomicroarcula sp. S1AR25-4]|uniref:DUF2971 domain-containing protein n=1 Tax=Haloarcula sp. S1AR25-4 TaxID=2950538 RepID=UPI002876EF51|nr:DUF2971 domain-containing protein [Halomicroarcula sp. S1AR25-4]MDS0276454.1 DUF2971 domain-containing protein [Halomicroarcula sp. S1AR25-4]